MKNFSILMLAVAFGSFTHEAQGQTLTKAKVIGRFDMSCAEMPLLESHWDFTSGGRAVQKDKDMGTWKVEGERVIITYSEKRWGQAVLKFKDDHTLVGKNNHRDGKVFNWVLTRNGPKVADRPKEATGKPVTTAEKHEQPRFTSLDISDAATVASTRIFNQESLVFPQWGKQTFHGVPFMVIDPEGGKAKNAICLYSNLGKVSAKMPKAVRLGCDLPAKEIHLLGAAGWGVSRFQVKNTLSMVVRLEYADGDKEDHQVINGVHFTDWAKGPNVPGSKNIGVLQVRYFSIVPKRQDALIRAVEFRKGTDLTSPLVMAVTVETPATQVAKKPKEEPARKVENPTVQKKTEIAQKLREEPAKGDSKDSQSKETARPQPKILQATDAEAYARSAEDFARKKDFDRAITEATEAIRLDAKCAQAYSLRANAYGMIGEHDHAISDATEAIRLDSKNVRAYYCRATSLRFKNDFDHAIADATEAIRLNSKHFPSYSTRADAYRMKDDFDHAIADATEAIRLNSKWTFAYDTRADAYRMKKEYDRAIADATEAIRLNPKYANAYSTRADAYRMKDDYDQAIADATEAIRLNPKYAFAYNTRGLAFLQKNEFASAIDDLSEALRLTKSLQHKSEYDVAKRYLELAKKKRLEAVPLAKNDKDAAERKAAELRGWEKREIGTDADILHRLDLTDCFCLAFSLDGRYLATSCKDAIKVWNVKEGKEVSKCVPQIQGNAETLYSTSKFASYLAFSADGKCLYAAGARSETSNLLKVYFGTIFVFDSSTGEQNRHYDYSDPGNGGKFTMFSLNGDYFVTNGKIVEVFSSKTGKRLYEFDLVKIPGTGFADLFAPVTMSPDDKRLLIAGRYGRMHSLPDGKEAGVLQWQGKRATDACFCPDGKNVALKYADNKTIIYNIETGKETLVLEGSAEYYRMAVSSAGGVLAAWSGGGQEPAFWNLSNGKRIRLHKNFPKKVTSVAFSPNDGCFGVSAENGMTIYKIANIQTTSLKDDSDTKPKLGEGNERLRPAENNGDKQKPEPLPKEARKLDARVKTISEDMLDKMFTQNIQNLTAYATDKQIILDFDVDRKNWLKVPRCLSLTVRVFDKDGKYITHFVTKETFTASPGVYDDWIMVVNQMKDAPPQAQAELLGGFTPKLLEANRNRLIYNVNPNLLKNGAIVEIGLIYVKKGAL